jgi:type I restriction enzyme, S subunit
VTSAPDWLPSVPHHWTVASLGFRYEVQLGKMLNPDAAGGDHLAPYLRNTDVQWGRINTDDLPSMSFDARERAKFALRPGDLLVCEGGDVGRAAIWTGELRECFYQKALHRVRPWRTGEEPRFLYYVLAAASARGAFLAEGNRSTIVHLTAEKLRAMRFPFAPPAEQRAIANFLDHKTAAFDALIAKKERLIAAAEERRDALISHVVLGALSTAKRRDSGTSLGALPEHWAAKRLMHLTAPGRPIMYGIVLPGPNVDDGVPIIKSGNCTRETLRPELLHKTTFEIEAGYERSRVAKDDIVYAIRGSVGMATLVPDDVAGANLTQDAARIAPAPDVNPRWLLYVVQSAPVWSQLAAGIVGATVKGINIRDLKRPFVPVPPRREQDEIAEHLDTEIGKLHELEASTAQSIDRLREYRQALIITAVTGQLDVAAQEAA